jgi:hypothetical protein
MVVTSRLYVKSTIRSLLVIYNSWILQILFVYLHINKIKMIREKQEKTGPIVIDLTGPDGNAFALMTYAKKFATQLGWKDRGAALINEMISGDYEHLLKVFDNAFGELVILER